MLTTLLLFDLDATLVRDSRAGRLAFSRAVESVTGVAPDLERADLAGKTDLIILRENLRGQGVDPGSVDETELVRTYLHHLAEAVARDPGTLCPGVRPLLDCLSGLPSLRLALGTGNLEPGARLKLAPHGLNPYFPTGGFGSDAAERAKVIAAGVARATAFYRTRFERVAVVGDSPRDVAAARCNGLHSIGVATGCHTKEDLAEAGATIALVDLTQVDELLEALDALPPTAAGMG